MLSNHTLQIIKQSSFTKRISGVPLGLQFSSDLAELYLEDFDLDIKKHFNPLAYFRYVDDIIILRYDLAQSPQEQQSRKQQDLMFLDEVFRKYSLQRNVKKTQFSYYTTSNNFKKELDFDFLGYNFKSQDKLLSIGISHSKDRKLRQRINLLFREYNKSSKNKEDFWRLYYKLKNTVFGIISYDKRGMKFKFGLGYNYRFVNNNDNISELSNFIKQLIYALKLSSNKTHTLLSIINYHNRPIDLLKKRYNYISITDNQKEQIANRLKISNLPNNKNFAKRLFYELYVK